MLALLVMMAISLIGMAAVWLSTSTLKVSGFVSWRQEAVYVAEAGMTRARQVLGATPYTHWYKLLCGDPDGSCSTCNPSTANCPPAPATGDDVRTYGSSTPSERGDPVSAGYILYDRVTTGANTPLYRVPVPGYGVTPTPGVVMRYTVWIRNDQREAWEGFTSTASGGTGRWPKLFSEANKTVVVRALGEVVQGATYAGGSCGRACWSPAGTVLAAVAMEQTIGPVYATVPPTEYTGRGQDAQNSNNVVTTIVWPSSQ